MEQKEAKLQAMQKEMQNLKAHFPFRIVWGAFDPVHNSYEVGANVTLRQVNDRLRKGMECYKL